MNQRFGYVEPAALRVIVADLEAAYLYGNSRINPAAQISNHSGVDGVGHRNHLEGTAQLIHALGNIVAHRFGIGFAASVRVEHRERNHRDDFPCVYVEYQAGGAERLQIDHRG